MTKKSVSWLLLSVNATWTLLIPPNNILQPKGAVITVKSENCLKLLAQFMTKFCTFLLSKCFLPDQLIFDIALSQL